MAMLVRLNKYTCSNARGAQGMHDMIFLMLCDYKAPVGVGRAAQATTSKHAATSTETRRRILSAVMVRGRIISCKIMI